MVFSRFLVLGAIGVFLTSLPFSAYIMFQLKNALRQWYRQYHRDLPWRSTTDPYLIWVSEVVLQQTRIAQGMGYYLEFTRRFPDVRSLAMAQEDEVLKQWQGLGYYSRARNMHAAAKDIWFNRAGVMPSSYSEWLQIKGVGNYTAAAISSICFGEPVAAIDGNVNRVISRLFAIDLFPGSTRGKALIASAASELIDDSDPGGSNQALIELGALVCVKSPDCVHCPVSSFCAAYALQLTMLLPVRKPKAAARIRYFHYLIPIFDGTTWMRKRPSGDIWEGLYDFPLIEKYPDLSESPHQLLVCDIPSAVYGADFSVKPLAREYTHPLTHQSLKIRFYALLANQKPSLDTSSFVPVSTAEIDNYPLPGIIDRFLAENGLFDCAG